MKKTLLKISIICSLPWAGALFAEPPIGTQGTEQGLQLIENANITKIITNTFTCVKILATHPAISMTGSEAILERGNERNALNVGEGFFVSDLLTATQTNIAYALIAKRHKSGAGYSRSDERLISIQLPMENQPLGSYIINTIFNMNDLNTEEGRSWIRDLKDVSADGSRLLVEKSEPHKLNKSTTVWEYKIMILDVPQKTFSELDWKKKGSIP